VAPGRRAALRGHLGRLSRGTLLALGPRVRAIPRAVERSIARVDPSVRNRPLDAQSIVLLSLAAGAPVRWDRLVARCDLSEDAVSHAIDALLERASIAIVREPVPALASFRLTPRGRGELARALSTLAHPRLSRAVDS